ncbi:MAG: mannose-1-phosphate guanylyltransferase [Candidatus Zixiibacteriota bacterium]|nr:MAG: mannose-1-phosphate guanylyltransferase [candidate division Zixibacteria bacterium]HHI01960.1 mannose-1-phosphate guanylyltransferase [candidate division Zixibacteria bacterium]
MIHGVILAGGKGERFWPLSRAEYPKQLLRLISSKTMLQETIDRILPLISSERILVVTSEDIVSPILDEISMLKRENILAEPFGRDTCLAIGLAAMHIRKIDPEAVMVVLSADHIIKPAEKLLEIVSIGAQIARDEDRLITIGINPTRAETNYGYIKMAEPYKVFGGISVYEVEAFTEKPKPLVASGYYYGHKHLWNSGMFIWSVDSILKAINSCQPETANALDEYAISIGTENENEAIRALYNKCDPISIDFAVLENAENVLTIRGDIVWDDVGSWNALERYKTKDQDNNVVIGDARLLNTYETTIYNDNDGIIVSLGVSDLVIVKTRDIVLVAHKTQVNDVRKILAELSKDDSMKRYL